MNFSRMLPTALGLATLLSLFGSATDSVAAPKQRPNIVFIFTDDHASHSISAYGSRINKTPNLDRLAKEGMLFRNAFCTNSICAPSRAVILTGKHSHRNGVMSNREKFDGSQMTFPKLLGPAGYQTAMIGKWHLKSTPTGFDYFRILTGQGSYYNPVFLGPKGPDARKQHTGYATDITTDLAINWLEKERDKSKPFVLMCQHKAPHRTWMPGPEHLTMYDDVTIPEPPTLFDNYHGRGVAATMQAMTIEHHMFDQYDLKLPEGGALKGPQARLNEAQRAKWDAAYGPKNKAFLEAKLTGKALVRWKYQRYIKDYLRCIASVDDNVGRLLDHLEATGLADNTIVIYSSDQGFYLGDHGWYDKRWMYEESLRMPLIVRWPGVVKPGQESRALVQNLDFAPTFLDACGVEIPEAMQGESLVPILQGQTPADWRKSIYYHYYEGYYGAHKVIRHYGVRDHRYKLIYFYPIKEWELYDLEKDPQEMKSVYDDPDYAETVKTLKAELKRLRKQYKVPRDDKFRAVTKS